ncbi:hypothetical protein CRG98_047609 [Punica granatum]|uniref:Uncharacterized protein n=1 Tax=Punica granatum TaxID=22663 RepID=A0A2I0HKK0_PUNGR|nr:hypothetical protein CRG98_047609 [Punica granatum]
MAAASEALTHEINYDLSTLGGVQPSLRPPLRRSSIKSLTISVVSSGTLPGVMVAGVEPHCSAIVSFSLHSGLSPSEEREAETRDCGGSMPATHRSSPSM